MKTSELIGAALDWAVAKCEGLVAGGTLGESHFIGGYRPSLSWAQGGPIIEREKIHVTHSHSRGDWRAFIANSECGDFYGPTPLIAAMRCYVASKLGDEVNVPEELK